MVCWLSCWSGVINGREVKVARAGVDGELLELMCGVGRVWSTY